MITFASSFHFFVVVVQWLSYVRLFATPWAAACQASLSFTISQSLLKLMSIELVMPSTISSSVVPFSFCPKSFPASGYFPRSQQSWAENGTTMINLQGRDWFIIENMYKISILLQTICIPMDCSMPAFPVLHHLPKFAQVHVICISDAICHLILWYPLLLLPSIFHSIRDFS